MCGIVGFIGRGDCHDLRGMVASLAHRGPDSDGIYMDKKLSVYLGHRRLKIIDINDGAQPMKTDDEQHVVIFNGEIYNADILRRLLESRGHVFKTSHSDTEVLLHGYKEWGADITNELNGMWSFAVYDKQKESLFISRDRFGQKPLFYTYQNGIFAFSSELRAFKKHSQLELNYSVLGLQKYCGHGFFPGVHTPYQKVYKLEGGFNLTIDINSLKFKKDRYWSYQIEPDEGKGKEKEAYWVDQIRDLLEKSVKRRLVSDVPLGVFLSGGLDSSAITYYAAKYVESSQLNTFSIGFSEASFDETKYASFVSKYLGTNHSMEVLSSNNLDKTISKALSKSDDPLSDSSLLSFYLLCKFAREKVTVVLGGDGSDELFAGYDTFRAVQVAQMIKRFLPMPVHKGIRSILAWLPQPQSYMSLQFKMQRFLMGINHSQALWQPLWLGPLTHDSIRSVLGKPISLEELYSEAIELWDSCKNGNPIDKSLQFYSNLFLQNQILVKVDRMSMLHGLEVRSPFLDIDLVNCIRKIPSYFKITPSHTKYIFKKAMEHVLPSHIVWRKKVGFSAPLGRWFADGSIKSVGNHFSSVEAKNIIDEKVTEHISGKNDHRLFLWNIYVLSEFLGKS